MVSSPADSLANARNAAEIHGFCAAVPEVKIHFPPAESRANFWTEPEVSGSAEGSTELTVRGAQSGPVYEFHLNHVLVPDSPTALFRTGYEEV